MQLNNPYKSLYMYSHTLFPFLITSLMLETPLFKGSKVLKK